MYASSSLRVMIQPAVDWRERVAAQPNSVWPATRTRHAPRVANRRSLLRTPPRDRPGRNRATRHAAVCSAASSRTKGDGSSLCLQPRVKAVGHRSKRAVRLPQRRDPGRPQRIKLAPAAAPLRGGIADPRFEEALALEPVDSGVDGVDRHIAPRAGVNLLSDSGSVR